MAKSDAMRAAVLAAVLLAGSCAAPSNDGMGLMADPDVNHPITVESGHQKVLLSYAPGGGLMPEDAARFDEFVQGYLASGNGAVTVAAPRGPGSQGTIEYFGERLVAAGVDRSRILVGTRDQDDGRVELGYVTYVAHTDPCGDWSVNAADTGSNLPMPNYGCAVQQNIAAQVADPRDLLAARPMGAADAMRRNTVYGHYIKGEHSQAEKKTIDKESEQSGVSSDIPQ